MIRRLIHRISASQQTFRFIHVGDEVEVGANSTVERHVELYRYERLAKPKFLGRRTSIVQSMEDASYIIFNFPLDVACTGQQRVK